MASSSPPQQAVAKRQADMALMPPPPPAKKIKRPSTVLDEDTYTDALSHIIARDFFPGLLEVQTKQEFLDAMDSKDKAWIARAGKRLSEVMTPGGSSSRDRLRGATPYRDVLDTPVSTTSTRWKNGTPVSVASTPSATPRSNIDGSLKNRGPDVSNLSLNSFHAKYTSEDNESFNKVLDNQNAKRREKYAWKWSGNKILSARQIAHRQREAKRIADQGGTMKDSGSGELVLSTDLDARPAVPDTWKTGVENSFMFTPASVEDHHETRQQKAEVASRAGPKHVLYGNTRLNNNNNNNRQDGSSVPPSPSLSAIKDAIAGRLRDESTMGEYTGGETPRVNGYAFVDEDEPEEDDDAVYERLRLLASEGSSGGDTTPNPFNIKENRKREDLHHRMVDRVARKKRAEKAGISSNVPRFPSSPNPLFTSASRLRTPVGSKTPNGKPLTPAAQKLLAKVGSTPRQASSSSGLRNIWTPAGRRK
jgi:protein DGCR14